MNPTKKTSACGLHINSHMCTIVIPSFQCEKTPMRGHHCIPRQSNRSSSLKSGQLQHLLKTSTNWCSYTIGGSTERLNW